MFVYLGNTLHYRRAVFSEYKFYVLKKDTVHFAISNPFFSIMSYCNGSEFCSMVEYGFGVCKTRMSFEIKST